ncbi:hypothetical protein VPH35_050864 [Triticum aestivum]
MCRGIVTWPHRHDQGDDNSSTCSCCSPTLPPSTRSDDSLKLCGTACAKMRAAGAPPPHPPTWPTTRARPHHSSSLATRCFSHLNAPAPDDLGISIDRLSKRYLAQLPHS